ncbi:MAG: glycerophosphodiester phosphodiesterase [Actinomycetaceae bacterium]|nr:glycerophosphodiester phosphodiesterase [Actinomycetaceae bacterium]
MYSIPRKGFPLVIAHRGGAELAPENSWESFETCNDLGFNYVESDAHLTADGKVVLIHDPVLERVSNGFGAVATHTWEELQGVTVNGSKYGPVLLEDVLASFPNMRLNLDAKEEAVWKPMIDVIRRQGATDRVLLASFNSSRLERIRAYAPEIQTSIGQAEAARLFGAVHLGIDRFVSRSNWPLRGIVAAQVPLTAWRVPIVTKRFVYEAHRLGLAVHVWTLNEPGEIVRALEAGADGIISDNPVLAREIIKARGRL